LIHFYKRYHDIVITCFPADMALSKIFAIRGFLAFVAFMEFVNALRSLLPSVFTVPEESFVRSKVFSLVNLSDEAEPLVAQLFGFYSLLNSIVLLHTSFFCQLGPIVSLGLVTTSAKFTFFILQGFHHKTIANNTHLQVPLFINSLCILSLLLLATRGSHSLLREGAGGKSAGGSENDDLLRAMRFNKSRKKKDL